MANQISCSTWSSFHLTKFNVFNDLNQRRRQQRDTWADYQPVWFVCRCDLGSSALKGHSKLFYHTTQSHRCHFWGSVQSACPMQEMFRRAVGCKLNVNFPECLILNSVWRDVSQCTRKTLVLTSFLTKKNCHLKSIFYLEFNKSFISKLKQLRTVFHNDQSKDTPVHQSCWSIGWTDDLKTQRLAHRNINEPDLENCIVYFEF